MLQPNKNKERPIFTTSEMRERPVLNRKIDDDLIKRPSAKKYTPTKKEAQNLRDASAGVNRNPQKSDMIGIPMDNASITHLRKKFNK